MPRFQFAFIKRAGTFFLNGVWDRINFYAKGRYLAKVSDTHVDILGFVSRSSDKSVKSFENLVNTMYNLDLKGY